MASKTPVAKAAPSKALTNYNEELAKYAKQTAETEASVSLGKFLSIKGGQLAYNGNPVPGNKMNVIIIDAVMENHYYTEGYDPDNPAAPVCFAFGRSDGEMAPHEKSTDPQHEACKGCPMNEYGTAEKGKGKACKNVRRLSLITEDGLNDVEAAEIAYLKVPVTSVKSWAGYAQQLNTTMNLPPFGVVTEISVTPDPKTQVKVNFKLVEKVDDEYIGALLQKRKGGEEAIMFPYSAVERTEQPKQNNANRKFIKGKGGR